MILSRWIILDILLLKQDIVYSDWSPFAYDNGAFFIYIIEADSFVVLGHLFFRAILVDFGHHL